MMQKATVSMYGAESSMASPCSWTLCAFGLLVESLNDQGLRDILYLFYVLTLHLNLGNILEVYLNY